MALEAFVNYSHENVSELILHLFYSVQLKLLPEELKSFLISWTNRIPQKQLSLVIARYNTVSSDTSDENMEIIEKYTKFSVNKRF